MNRPWLYFTCPAEWRNTLVETNAEKILLTEFPHHAVTGPRQKMREMAITRAHPAFHDPTRFHDSIRDRSDFCVALIYPDGRIPIDVFDDMSWFLARGEPVFILDEGGTITRYTGTPYYKLVLSLEETQQRLNEKEATTDDA